VGSVKNPRGHAGDLLPIEAIERSGLAVTSEGAFVRALSVGVFNPQTLDGPDEQRIAAGLCALIGRLRAEETMQFYVTGSPVDRRAIADDITRQVASLAGDRPIGGQQAASPLSLSQWRMHDAIQQGVIQHSETHAAMQRACYLILPFLPEDKSARSFAAAVRAALPGTRKLQSASLRRGARAHRRASRESHARMDVTRADLEALGVQARPLSGEEFAALMAAPLSEVAKAPSATGFTDVVLGGLDQIADTADAAKAAEALRSRIARTPIDLKRSNHDISIGRDVEQTIFVSGTADATRFAWLMQALLTRSPHRLSVYITATDRASEKRRLKLNYKRLREANAMMRGRGSTDFDRDEHEAELAGALQDMAGHDRAGFFRVSIYMTLRAPGPDPDLDALAESVKWCHDALADVSDASVDDGVYGQHVLFSSTLPLGRDEAGRTRKYGVRNAGDTIPLIGTSCSSPRGIPFAYSDPGAELQLFNPWDREHSNGMATFTGLSGSGKTTLMNKLLGSVVAVGASGFVFDRAGHFRTLTTLIDGSAHLQLGADSDQHAINPWDVNDPVKVAPSKVAFLVSLHSVLMGGQDAMTLTQRSLLADAIRGAYARSVQVGEAPRELHLHTELLARAAEREGEAPEQSVVLRDLAQRIGEFCGDGAYSWLLDRPTTVNRDAPLVVFDSREIPEEVLQTSLFAQMEFVRRALERRRVDPDLVELRSDPALLAAGRSVLLIDEGWRLFQSMELGQYANDMARRSRHLNLAFWVASQYPKDFDTDAGRALMSGASQHFFLEQKDAEQMEFAAQAAQLSDRAAGLIGRLKTQKGRESGVVWVNGRYGVGRVAVRLGALEYWAYTSEPNHDVPMRDAAIEAHDGNVWAALAALADGWRPGQREPMTLAGLPPTAR
jgi:hypothetical protein